MGDQLRVSLSTTVLWCLRGFLLGSHDAERRQSLAQLNVWSVLYSQPGYQQWWHVVEDWLTYVHAHKYSPDRVNPNQIRIVVTLFFWLMKFLIGTKLNSVWFQKNRKGVITIQIRSKITRFRKDLSACMWAWSLKI